MERKRKVDLGDDDPFSSASAAAGTSGSDSARKRRANGGSVGDGDEEGNGGNAAAAANGKHLLREFDETATVSPYTGREYSKKYFDILEKRKGESERRGTERERERETKKGRAKFFHRRTSKGDKTLNLDLFFNATQKQASPSGKPARTSSPPSPRPRPPF